MSDEKPMSTECYYCCGDFQSMCLHGREMCAFCRELEAPCRHEWEAAHKRGCRQCVREIMRSAADAAREEGRMEGRRQAFEEAAHWHVGEARKNWGALSSLHPREEWEYHQESAEHFRARVQEPEP